MFESAGITIGYGHGESAYSNPAAPLLSMECADYVSAKLTQFKLTQSIYSIIYSTLRQGIIFVFSENGVTINSVAAFIFLPGGYRNNNNGNFNNIGNNGNFWSSTEKNSNNAWNRNLNYNNTKVNRNNNNKQNGFSVRCIRDLKFKIISLFSFIYKV